MKKKHKPKPNFLIIGAAKAGTTSLAGLLNEHPDAGIALGEQPNFFSFDDRYQLGWKKYLRLFEHCVGKSAIGDASRSYSRIRYHPQVVERICEHIPDAKIIYMVRHPLDRMASAYVERMGYQNPPPFSSINDAVRNEPMIVDSSRYWEVLEAYSARFDGSQIKIVWFEEYVANTNAVYREVCRFLEIDDSLDAPSPRPHAHPSADLEEARANFSASGLPVNTAWDDTTREWVIGQIKEDNLRFLQHFGRPADYWGGLFTV